MDPISQKAYKDMFQKSAADVIAQLLQNPASVPHDQLLALRRTQGFTDPMSQQLLAPYEHQAFAREYASQGPIQATGVAAATPAYAAAKGLGVLGSRSGSSDPLAQILAGFKGAGQGLMQWANRPEAPTNPGSTTTSMIGVRG